MKIFHLLALALPCALVLHSHPLYGQTPNPAQGTPKTVEEGYATLVPESVQTARKDAQVAGQIQNLQDQIKQLEGKTADKATVEKLTNQVNQISQYQSVLQQAIVAQQNELNKIEVILNSYGQGYKAAQAASLRQQEEQNRANRQPVPRSTDPLNP
jgi:TolA-binding protein